MIDWNTQLKIQAFLDGELDEAEARKIAALIASDHDSAALHAELKNTRCALYQAGDGIKVPETREFYWSKISREIEKLERQETAARSVSVLHVLARWLRPLGVVAAVAIVGLYVWRHTGGGNSWELIVTAQVDSGAVVYQDASSGTTLVWFTSQTTELPARTTSSTSPPTTSDTLDWQ
jgi:anti-sigma factor RsiW